jgi:hypothetical protein
VRNDTNTAWVGGYAPGSANVLENGFCKLYCANTTVSGVGVTLTVKWNIEIKLTMAGKTCPAWMLVDDDAGLRDGWDKMGMFDISQPPTNVSVSPSSGSIAVGQKVTLTSKYADPDGYTKVELCYLLINTDLVEANAVHMLYNAKTNKLYVRNNANTAWIGGYSPGSAYVIDNSYVRLFCAETTVSGAGTTRTVNWKVIIKPTMSGKSCRSWLKVQDNTGLVEDWTQKGTLVFSQLPVNISLYPNVGTLAPERDTTFTSKYSDPDGNADLANCYLVMNTTLTGTNGIYVRYEASTNKLYLRNDANTEWLGGYAPGSSYVIENNSCRLDCSQTTINRSGMYLTVNWKIRIKSTMVGRVLTAWMLVTDSADLRDGYDVVGNFRVGPLL